MVSGSQSTMDSYFAFIATLLYMRRLHNVREPRDGVEAAFSSSLPAALSPSMLA
jgi:hypothetical protein